VVEAQELGIRGVPFYVMDHKYGVSGAQSSDVFLQTLNTSFGEWQQKKATVLDIADGEVCTPEGDCN
jgi:protein disulfide-isomerase